METAELIEGIIRILRDNVDGWSTEDGHPHVYPTHPPDGLTREDYPRATVDIIGNNTTHTDVEHKRFIENVLVDVTVYAVDSYEANRLMGEAKQAIIENHDSFYYNKREEEVDYLPNWSFVGPGTLSPILEEGVDEGLTRYNRTSEFGFRTINFE